MTREPNGFTLSGFGTDGTGRICFTNDGSIPSMAGSCNTLE